METGSLTTPLSSNNIAGNEITYGGTLQLKCYSGMVQISFQAVTPKSHTETFLKLDLEYKKRVSKKNTEKLRKQYNYNFYPFFISSWPA